MKSECKISTNVREYPQGWRRGKADHVNLAAFFIHIVSSCFVLYVVEGNLCFGFVGFFFEEWWCVFPWWNFDQFNNGPRLRTVHCAFKESESQEVLFRIGSSYCSLLMCLLLTEFFIQSRNRDFKTILLPQTAFIASFIASNAPVHCAFEESTFRKFLFVIW